MASKVTCIPATYNFATRIPNTEFRRRKVAGYARVSTDDEEQLTSYAAQVDYYENKIKNNPEWEYVNVYTDEGISGTNTKHREGFNQMITDALSGKIDLIITKSVSRFARNTVDSLVTIRELKAHNVEVFFEKENIYTFDGKGELLLTIMASLAQEESRSISENVTWGQRKRFADGKVCMPYSQFLGYEKGPTKDSPPVINEEQAEHVRLIYKLFLDGMTPCGIAAEMEKRQILSPGGKTKWYESTIESILTNEKYKGDARLQKTFTVDFLTKKTKINEGEVDQYYVRDSHPAIISPDEWDLVEIEIDRRKRYGKKYSGKSVLAARIVCADCGGFYGRKLWHSTDKYRKYIWQCNDKFKGVKCRTPVIDEEIFKQKFLKAYNQMLVDKKRIIEDCETLRLVASDTSEFDSKIEALEKKICEYDEKMKKLVNQASDYYTGSQDDFISKFELLEEKKHKAEATRTAFIKKREEVLSGLRRVDIFINQLLSKKEFLKEWDNTVWIMNIDRAVVHENGDIVFCFIGGYEITIKAD